LLQGVPVCSQHPQAAQEAALASHKKLEASIRAAQKDLKHQEQRTNKEQQRLKNDAVRIEARTEEQQQHIQQNMLTVSDRQASLDRTLVHQHAPNPAAN